MKNHHYNKHLKSFATELRTTSISKAEKYLWRALLCRNKMGVKFKRQRPIHNYIVDFLSQEINLIIEIDGNSHFNKGEYDAKRQRKLEELGFSFLRFGEGEVINNIAEVYSAIAHAIYCLKGEKSDVSLSNPPPSPLQRGKK
ncbi:MAG: endonuclease domain-containing protein [Fluviicola sp.]|nr:endonuclease domain-containing protein [Fluviicola sp.]